MKKQHAKKWIKALRSGKYKQTKNKLRNNGGFCCLGVLDEIFPKKQLSGGDFNFLENYERIGLHSSDGELLGDDGYYNTSLSFLNDNGFTFDEIADVIQIEYVEGL